MKKDQKINCYSDGEGAFMTWSQNLREKLLGPLLEIMGSNGIRAGHVTFLSLVCGLLACPLFVAGHYLSAFAFLFLHVLLDGIDGPLARYLGRAGNRGSFTDTVADQLVIAATTITLVHTGHIGTWAGGWYLFFYTVVVAFAFIRNALASPYSWLLRPRFLVFAWIAVDVWWWEGSLDRVVWLATAILVWKALTGFLAILRRIS